MSIMPEGGWVDPPRQDAQQRPVYLQQPTHTPRSSYLTCKICDRGELSSKSIFRMSVPVVVIGWILLVPCIAGMLISGLMLLGFITPTGYTSRSGGSYQSEYDSSFRRSCAKSTTQSNQAAGYHASPQLIEEYCECALSTVKETGSEITAAQTCIQRAREGTLEPPSHDVEALYSTASTSNSSLDVGTRIFGSTFAIICGIASFVGGLLGWLLVMKKRVLQCNVCGAVVNAS